MAAECIPRCSIPGGPTRTRFSANARVAATLRTLRQYSVARETPDASRVRAPCANAVPYASFRHAYSALAPTAAHSALAQKQRRSDNKRVAATAGKEPAGRAPNRPRQRRAETRQPWRFPPACMGRRGTCFSCPPRAAHQQLLAGSTRATALADRSAGACASGRCGASVYLNEASGKARAIATCERGSACRPRCAPPSSRAAGHAARAVARARARLAPSRTSRITRRAAIGPRLQPNGARSRTRN